MLQKTKYGIDINLPDDYDNIKFQSLPIYKEIFDYDCYKINIIKRI